MSGVDFLARLLDGVPVEWIPIGSLGELIRGSGLQKKDFTESGVPAIHYGQIYTYYGLSTKTTKSFVKPELAKQLRKVDKGDVILTNTSENLADVGKALVYLGDTQAVTGGHATIIKPGNLLLGKYLAYFTQTDEFSDAKRKYAKGTKVIDVSATDMAKIPIPIPCPDNPKKSLEIQAEIVRILDAFTKLTAELTAELTARKKQYNYYRDQLLSFEDGEVEWRPLGDVCRLINGRAYKQPELLENGKYPVLRVGNFFSNGNWYYSDLELDEDKYCDNGDLLYAWSASFGPKIWDGKKVIYHYHIWKVVPNADSILKKYLFHVLAWDTDSLKSEHGTGSTMMHIGKGSIEKRLIPVPTLSEQARIVEILDKFQVLTNSITEGLPREIELRQKQYAYYRDLLLSFPKTAETAEV